ALFSASAATVAGLACTDGQVAKWAGGWTCGVDANGGGTVTAVGTGAGLTGGPVTGAGTIAVAAGGITAPLLADGAVTSPKIANGAVGSVQINPAQVHARIGGACAVGEYLRGINPDGSVFCTPLPNPHVSLVVDDAAEGVGATSDVAIGA